MKVEMWPWRVTLKDGSSLALPALTKLEIEIPDEVIKAYAEKVLGLMTYERAMTIEALEPHDDLDFSDEERT